MNGAPKVPELITRKPTGKPSWPMILLAGGEKSGKSWAGAAFSASEMVGRTFFIEVGEHYADEYGAIPGARYEIVPHDGTYRSIARAVWAATKQERVDGKPNAIIFDSGTVLWDMLSDHAQRTANRRWRAKNPNAPEPEDEVQITMDLWNVAKDRFAEIARMLYQFDGPAIITARLEQVAVVGGGKPTNEKAWKVRAEKNLPFEVDAVIQARKPRTWEITGLRSTRIELPVGETIPMPGFTVEGFLRKLGLDEEGATAPRSVTLLRPDAPPQAPQRPGQRPPLATPEQKQQLAILIGQKLGKQAAARRHAVMSTWLGRNITSFDQLLAPEAFAAIRELSQKPDWQPPNTDARYAELRAELEKAQLEGIDPVMSNVIASRDDHQITQEQCDQLSELAEGRSLALVADGAVERDWTPEAAQQPLGASA